jgi:hypothetical protein
MIDQSQVVAGIPGSGGLRREVLIRTATTNRIGGHEEQHHANMANPRLPRAPITGWRRHPPISRAPIAE